MLVHIDILDTAYTKHNPMCANGSTIYIYSGTISINIFSTQ